MDKQPKKFKFFLLNFMNLQIKIDFEKNFCSKRKIPLKYIFSIVAIKNVNYKKE